MPRKLAEKDSPPPDTRERVSAVAQHFRLQAPTIFSYVDAVAQLRPQFTCVQSYVSIEGRHDGMTHLDDLMAGASSELDPPEVEDEDTTILMYTSGTTALPKAVLLTYNDFTAYVCGTVELADGSERGTALLSAPLYHIAGATNIMTALFAGRRLASRPSPHARRLPPPARPSGRPCRRARRPRRRRPASVPACQLRP